MKVNHGRYDPHTREYEVLSSINIRAAVIELLRISRETNEPTWMDFNGIRVEVQPADQRTPEQIVAEWSRADFAEREKANRAYDKASQTFRDQMAKLTRQAEREGRKEHQVLKDALALWRKSRVFVMHEGEYVIKVTRGPDRYTVWLDDEVLFNDHKTLNMALEHAQSIVGGLRLGIDIDRLV